MIHRHNICIHRGLTLFITNYKKIMLRKIFLFFFFLVLKENLHFFRNIKGESTQHVSIFLHLRKVN